MSERDRADAGAQPARERLTSAEPETAGVHPDVARLLSLQRSVGNAAVSRLLARQEGKGGALLTDGDSASGAMPVAQFIERVRATLAPAEGAARLEPWLVRAAALDAAALEQALRQLAPRAITAASPEELVTVVCERLRELDASEQQQPAVQAKRAEGAPVPPDAPHALLERLGAGEPLPTDVRSPMEAAFEQSFADVRVHRDEPAAALSRELSARAFAVGPHVAFGAGEYAPGTPVGDALIAHELAHVQQQRGAHPAVERKNEVAAPPAPALEEDADRSAVHAVASLWGLARPGSRGLIENSMPRLRSGLRLNRCAGVQVRPAAPDIRIPTGPVAAGTMARSRRALPRTGHRTCTPPRPAPLASLSSGWPSPA
jgi:Domain of unknown function (DUF4157)